MDLGQHKGGETSCLGGYNKEGQVGSGLLVKKTRVGSGHPLRNVRPVPRAPSACACTLHPPPPPQIPEVLVQGHTDDVYAMAFHPKKPHKFATVCDSANVFLWNAKRRQLMVGGRVRGSEADGLCDGTD